MRRQNYLRGRYTIFGATLLTHRSNEGIILASSTAENILLGVKQMLSQEAYGAKC
jgi:hypothetical protein